jgi:DNA-binding MarR family transcriptional regulator
MSETKDHITTARRLNHLDPLLHHRSRLGAMILLTDVDAMSFSNLLTLLEETNGNLGAQLRRLEDAGYVNVKKEFNNRKPVTWYAISSTGRAALKKHIAVLELLINAANI